MKEAYVPEIYEKNRIDRLVNIDDNDAYEMARKLATEEGLFVGMSSGAAMFVALEQARQMTDGTLVVILPDSGERYLSTPAVCCERKGGINFVQHHWGGPRSPLTP